MLLVSGGAANLTAQSAALPANFIVVQTSYMSGPPLVQKLYGSGSKVVVDQSGGGTRTRKLYDLHARTVTLWDPDHAEIPCMAQNFTGDLPESEFATAAEMEQQGLKATGHVESVNGFDAKVMEVSSPQGVIRAWWSPKFQLVVKTEMGPNANPQLMEIVQQASLSAPDASEFALPASCAGVRVPMTEPQKMTRDTGDDPANFTDALLGPGATGACSMELRVYKAGTMERVTGGFQVGIDTTVDATHPGSYTMGEHTDGTESFSGGGLHEVTSLIRNGTLRLPLPSPQFNLLVHIAHGSDNQALIYRQCYAPQTRLLLILSQDTAQPNRWLWVKAGKFATAP
jgi:hypothetical protein